MSRYTVALEELLRLWRVVPDMLPPYCIPNQAGRFRHTYSMRRSLTWTVCAVADWQQRD